MWRKRLLTAIVLLTTAYSITRSAPTINSNQLDVRVIGTLKIGNQDVPVKQAGSWIDSKVNSETEFAIGLGNALLHMSERTGYEFCGQLCMLNGRWGARIITIESGRACPKLDICPGNQWKPSGTYLHSHRPAGGYQLGSQDSPLRVGQDVGDTVILATNRPSDEDLKEGGWLVEGRHLWHIVNGQAKIIHEYDVN